MSKRLTKGQLAAIRDRVRLRSLRGEMPSDRASLLAELDAVTRERDEAEVLLSHAARDDFTPAADAERGRLHDYIRERIEFYNGLPMSALNFEQRSHNKARIACLELIAASLVGPVGDPLPFDRLREDNDRLLTALEEIRSSAIEWLSVTTDADRLMRLADIAKKALAVEDAS